MTSMTSQCTRKEASRGAWTAEEDQKLAQAIKIYGPKKWKFVAARAGLNRCGKSCRLRWMNYLRPNIKRGNISDQEEDLILRLHKLLGNRWSLIAGRLPGRTDNEIKNYWNSHLSKKLKQKEKQDGGLSVQGYNPQKDEVMDVNNVKELSVNETSIGQGESKSSFTEDDLSTFFSEVPLNLAWPSEFLDVYEGLFQFA